MQRILLITALGSLAAACAGTGPDAPPGRAPGSAADRGQHFAQRACAGCHAISVEGESPRGGAPAFGTIRLRMTAPALEKRLGEISQHGHYEMPPIFITQDEAKDVAAYIESLGGR